MFCKWCGGTITSSEIRCKRCGKEIPALSDCGGFYDLVPDARNNTVDQPETVASSSSSGSHHEMNPSDQMEFKNNKLSPKNNNLNWINYALTFMFFLFCLVIFSMVNKCFDEIDGIQNDLNLLTEKIDLTVQNAKNIESKLDEAIAYAVSNEADLKEQDVLFDVKLFDEDPIQKIDADLNLGDYVDTAVVSYELDKQNIDVNSVVCFLKKSNGTVTLSIDRNNTFRTKNISISYEIDDAVYGYSNSVTCKWQCRFNENAEWGDLPIGVFKQIDNTGKTELSISQATLRELTNESVGYIELRCEISRSNVNDGSLTIVVENIQIYEKTSGEETIFG